MKSLNQLALTLSIGIVALVTAASSYAEFTVNYIFAYEEIKPYGTYNLTMGYTQESDASELLVSLKNPDDNWATYARSKTPITRDGSSYVTASIDVQAAPECMACVWEVRVLPNIGDPDSAAILEQTAPVTIINQDEITNVELQTPSIVAGGSISVDVHYVASEARTIRVEFISTQSGVYTGVIEESVTPGENEISVELPISPNVSEGFEHFVSVKITPVGGQWFDYFSEINSDSLSVVTENNPSRYFWDYPLAHQSFVALDGPSPSATYYRAQIGVVENEDLYADENLPLYGLEEGLVIYGTASCCGIGYVLDLQSGDVLQFWFDETAEPADPVAGTEEDFWTPGIPSRYFVYQTISYSEEGDNSEYAAAIEQARDMLNRVVEGYYEDEGYAQFGEAVAYLNSILAAI